MATNIFTTLFFLFIASVHAKFDPIAFTVARSGHFTASSANTVPYPLITTNHMKSQAIVNGVFTCRDEGTYKCQVYSLSTLNVKMFLELWHNNNLVASLYGHVPSHYGAGGNSVVLFLSYGDTVQVKTRENTNVGLWGSADQVYNTFSCVQIGSEAISNEISVPAFSVTSNSNQNVIGGTSIIYDTELVDINNEFNLDTGVYTASSSGIYIFHFFSLAHQNEELWQDLYHNDQYVCSIKCITDFEWADAGNTVILHLNVNDTMTVKAHIGIINYLFGNTDQIFTTFAGVQIISDLDMMSPDSFPVVAFSVALLRNVTVAAGSSVPYDHVFVNYKNSFDVMKKHFVAPASGLYEFNYHGRSQQGSDVYLRLIHNQRYVNSLYEVIPGHHATAGNSAVLELAGGDTVRIEAQAGTNKLYGDPNEIYCTFSGYLLHAITPGEIIGK